MQIPGMGYGLRYEYGIFKQTIKDGWQCEQPDNWLRRPDPWEVARLEESVEVNLTVRSSCTTAYCGSCPGGRPALIGIPFDRPVVGYGGKTINTLRLWAAAAPDYFDFQRFSSGRFRGRIGRNAGGRVAHARALSRRLHQFGARGCDSCRNISWSPARWPISCAASGAATPTGDVLPEKVAIQLNDTHPTMAVPELMRILLDDAQLGWDQAWDLTQRRWPTRITRCCPKLWRNGRLTGSSCFVPRHPGDHPRDQSPTS